MNDSLGDRMKNNYESIANIRLIRRMPVIIRLDGRAFRTLTRKCEKPFDGKFIQTMLSTAKHLCEEIQGCKCAYVQSDEISLLLTDYDKFTTEAWFGNELQKMVSVSAALASSKFTVTWGNLATFDSRAFNLPREEVCNYFIWRQKDWIRNSIQMLGQANFSHKQLQHKSCSEIQDMLHEKSINWVDLPESRKNGVLLLNYTVFGWGESCPVFTAGREIIENLLIPVEI